MKNTVVIDNYAAAFLPSVLEGKKAVINRGGNVFGVTAINAEYAAFFS